MFSALRATPQWCPAAQLERRGSVTSLSWSSRMLGSSGCLSPLSRRNSSTQCLRYLRSGLPQSRMASVTSMPTTCTRVSVRSRRLLIRPRSWSSVSSTSSSWLASSGACSWSCWLMLAKLVWITFSARPRSEVAKWWPPARRRTLAEALCTEGSASSCPSVRRSLCELPSPPSSDADGMSEARAASGSAVAKSASRPCAPNFSGHSRALLKSTAVLSRSSTSQGHDSVASPKSMVFPSFTVQCGPIDPTHLCKMSSSALPCSSAPPYMENHFLSEPSDLLSGARMVSSAARASASTGRMDRTFASSRVRNQSCLSSQ
mmetsp:Transcript_52981/g.138075  ORF Transcript_52981/g.138075 Transcript_52981/m.138075 type:complete len:317 (-) Transcript_52981:381-1331(-)